MAQDGHTNSPMILRSLPNLKKCIIVWPSAVKIGTDCGSNLVVESSVTEMELSGVCIAIALSPSHIRNRHRSVALSLSYYRTDAIALSHHCVAFSHHIVASSHRRVQFNESKHRYILYYDDKHIAIIFLYHLNQKWFSQSPSINKVHKHSIHYMYIQQN